MKPAFIPLAIATAFALACADGTLPPRTANDPTNPDAPEVPIPPRATQAASTPALPQEIGVPDPPASHEHHPPSPPAAASPGGAP